MTDEINDPRLTAYALGELDGAELAEVEALLESSPAARAAVDEIRAAADVLTRELAAEPGAALTAGQRETIQAAATGGAGPAESAAAAKLVVRQVWWKPYAIAASILVLVGAPTAWVLAPQFQGLRSQDARVEQLFRTAQELQKERRFTEAADAMQTVLELEPLNARAALWRDAFEDAATMLALRASGGDTGEVAERMVRRTEDASEDIPLPYEVVEIIAGATGSTGSEAQDSVDRLAALGYVGGDGAKAWAMTSDLDAERLEQLQSLAYIGPEDKYELHRAAADTPVAAPNTGSSIMYSRELDAADRQELREYIARRIEAKREQDKAVQDSYANRLLLNYDPSRVAEVEALIAELEDSRVPWSSDIVYPKNWEELIGRERYDPVVHNPFLHVAQNPLSTFSIDVDTASYSIMRRNLWNRQLPPAGAVRVEEFINYFKYDYPQPTVGRMPVAQDERTDRRSVLRDDVTDQRSVLREHPFSVNVDISECPWTPGHRLMRVGLKGMEIEAEKRPICNLVFLVDVSGSMHRYDKLPLVKGALRILTDELWDDDQVAMVVYARASGLVLDSTLCSDRDAILDAVDRLEAGGSTNGGEGIELAYAVAAEHFIEGGVNRVILATDGDFNVGVTNEHDLVTLIEEKARGGVFLSVLGFGMGNYQDASLEKLADKGNGNYAYIDTVAEAEKVLGEQVGGTLVTIAKDVKIQVEFNPVEVAAYRLIGYENRLLAARDFNDDTKDAGEIGAGHTVTALYEIAPVGVETAWLDELRDDVAQTTNADVIPTTDGRRDLAETSEDSEQSGKIPRRFASRNDGETGDEEPGPATPPDPESLAEEDALPNIVADEWVDPLRYQTPGNLAAAALGIAEGEVATVKLRYKQPDGEVSQLLETPVIDHGVTLAETSDDFRFAASVASFGMLLRGSPYTPEWTFDDVLELASGGVGVDADGYRAEFVGLVGKAAELADQTE